MRLLLIRHGKAGDRDKFAKTGKPDELRPLTSKGRKEMGAIARGLRTAEEHIDVLATSPLTRAVETADAIAERYPEADRETTHVLTPRASFDDFVDWLRGHREHGLVAAVGHNTHLSDLARWLTDDDDIDDMKKGSALLLDFGADIGEGTAELEWYRKPKKLIALAD